MDKLNNAKLFGMTGFKNPVVEPTQPIFKEIQFGKRYQTVRNGLSSYVYPVESTRRDVVVKDQLSDKHTSSISKAKFEKYYQLAE